MKVLAVDTTSNTASAAVMEDSRLLGEYTVNHKKTHSQKIMVMIDELLKSLELTPSDMDLFAAAVGPGSFTGIRIGVSTIKGMAHAVNKPVVSVNTLEALAYNMPYCEHFIVPIMDARNNNVFTASYLWDEDFKEVTPPEAVSIDECIENCIDFVETVFVGDGVDVYREHIKEKLGDMALFPGGNVLLNRASSVAALALLKAENGETLHYNELVPFYIRKSQAEQELEKKLEGKDKE